MNPCLLRRVIPIFPPIKPIPITSFINILLPSIEFGGIIRELLERVNIFAIDFSIRWMVSRILITSFEIALFDCPVDIIF